MTEVFLGVGVFLLMGFATVALTYIFARLLRACGFFPHWKD